MPFSESERYGQLASKVDPRLRELLQLGAASLPEGYRVEATSGFRPGDPRFHGRGMASDVQIYDPQGKALGNYQDPASFPIYQQYANAVRAAQMQKYPDLAQNLRWGGYFGGPKSTYGAMDEMHFDLGGGKGLGMLGGSWDKGLNPEQAKLYGIDANGPGRVPGTTLTSQPAAPAPAPAPAPVPAAPPPSAFDAVMQAYAKPQQAQAVVPAVATPNLSDNTAALAASAPLLQQLIARKRADMGFAPIAMT